MTTIAVDAMGGDYGIEVTVPAAVSAATHHREHEIILVGLKDQIEDQLGKARPSNLRVEHASEQVEMDESPALALRKKKDSSMRVAINLIKDGEADACVSAGNTGALMATARFVLKTLPGIDRPSLVTTIPNMRPAGHVHVLDLGANVDSPAELLVQFGIMGSILVQSVEKVDRPKVALLNIGHEDIKGNDTIKAAAKFMRESNLNFVGFVEGDGIYTSDVDVIVCDGFVGNVAIKTSEGLAQMIKHILREEVQANMLTRLAGLASMPVLKRLGRRMDPRNYNGAPLVGLQGTVIKSHGGTDSTGFEAAIVEAVKVAATNVPERIRDGLGPLLGEQ